MAVASRCGPACYIQGVTSVNRVPALRSRAIETSSRRAERSVKHRHSEDPEPPKETVRLDRCGSLDRYFAGSRALNTREYSAHIRTRRRSKFHLHPHWPPEVVTGEFRCA